MAYTTREIVLSSLLREIEWDEPLDEKAKLDVYISTHMDAGDRLRREWERPDALALLASAKILAQREALVAAGEPRTRCAWVLRQLKTPAEVQTLRRVYGSRFFLIAAYTPDDERASWLHEAIKKSRRSSDTSKWQVTTAELLRRDQSEDGLYGQNVRDTFHRADLFVDAGSDANTTAHPRASAGGRAREPVPVSDEGRVCPVPGLRRGTDVRRAWPTGWRGTRQ